jgi:hypothetical protein
MSARVPARLSVAESADLMRGYRAARELQRLDVPPALAKQVANYICHATSELAARGIDAARLADDTAP